MGTCEMTQACYSCELGREVGAVSSLQLLECPLPSPGSQGTPPAAYTCSRTSSHCSKRNDKLRGAGVGGKEKNQKQVLYTSNVVKIRKNKYKWQRICT